MIPETFAGFLVNKDASGKVQAAVGQIRKEQLPPGDVLVEVEYSSLNYKDALAVTGHAGVVRRFPHVPGIDACGTVVESSSADVPRGAQVLLTGFGMGADRWGGYCEYVRAPAENVLPLPAGLSPREAMIYGTAGLTAAQCVDAIQSHDIDPAAGEIVVTGATGGVGSLAVGLLAKAGYQVAAVTGKSSAADFLKGLGAARILSREEVNDASDKPLLSAHWIGAVDTVGGTTLATILRSSRPYACVTACGLVGGAELPLTVYPFILRGVRLIGIDSNDCPVPKRRALWEKLAGPWKLSQLEDLATEINLSQLPKYVQRILSGAILGRTLVRPSAKEKAEENPR